MKQTATSIVERNLQASIVSQEFDGEQVFTIKADLVVMGSEGVFNTKLDFHIPVRIAVADMTVLPMMCARLDTGEQDEEIIRFMNESSPEGWEDNMMVTVMLEDRDYSPDSHNQEME